MPYVCKRLSQECMAMNTFGITLSHVDVALDILILGALIFNAMVIGRALEMLMEMYEEKSGLAAMERVVGGLLEWREDVKTEVAQEKEAWEEEWK
tara:strand:+ start:447 stop:731 length:285 start_codon:yes stop_codon:yes gene_type:complete